MPGFAIVVVDTMTFSSLQGLGRLDLLGQVGARSGRLVTTKAVIGQLHRSGRLGAWAQQACDHGRIRCESPTIGDPVSDAVANVLRRQEARLVRRNRADVELVELARHRQGCVLSCDRGIAELAGRRRTNLIDLLVFFLWAARLDLLPVEAVSHVTAPWWTAAGPGTGAPADLADSLAATISRRGPALQGDLDALMESGSPA